MLKNKHTIKIALLLLLVLNTGTTVLAQEIQGTPHKVKRVVVEEQPSSTPLPLPISYQAQQGKTIKIVIPRTQESHIDGTYQGEKIIFSYNKTDFTGYIGINRSAPIGKNDLNISLFTPGQGTKNYIVPIEIKANKFTTKSFKLAKNTAKLFNETLINNTWNLINQAKSTPETEQLWTSSFMVPTKGKVTLGFGDKLYINKKYSGSHFGLDYANKTGTEIYATNDGIVKMSSMTDSYGNTIVIDHGLNVYSMYLHLDKLLVTPGQLVKKGELIGKMGSTGLSTGSHLHFTMFVGNQIVDPQEWYDLSF